MGRTYYDYNPIMGRNTPYNFVCGARGLGKTYGAKKFAIKKYLRKGRKFIYLRRYNTELNHAGSFFADIAWEFPSHEFRVHGRTYQCRPAKADPDEENELPWEDMGTCLALSQSQHLKSVSYAEYDLIIFDEFIVEKGSIHYLPAEPKRFNDFYSTVDRYNDRVKVLFLANAVSMTNPYFIEYGVRLRKGQEWYTLGNGFVTLHCPDSAKFASEVEATRFGRFIRDTDPSYAEYAIDNKFTDDTDVLLGKKPADAVPRFTIYTPVGIMGVWTSQSSFNYFVTGKTVGDVPAYTTSRAMVSEDISYQPYSTPVMSLLRSYYERGQVRFDCPASRERFLEIYRR